MKTIFIALVITTWTLAACAQQSTDSGTNTYPILAHGFCYVVPSEEQTKTLDAALGRMRLEKQTKNQARNIDQAIAYLWQTISIAITSSPRICTDYRNFFWFSRLDLAGKDDQTFKSGFAVKKGTGEIYRWEDKSPNTGSKLAQQFCLIWRETSNIRIEEVPTPDGFKMSPAKAVKPIMARISRAPWAEFYLFVDVTNYYFGNTRRGTELSGPEAGHWLINGTTGKTFYSEEKNTERQR